MCDPIPDTCASTGRRVDLHTAAERPLVPVSSARFILDAVPSPDGARVALVAGRCGSTSSHLAIRDLRTRPQTPIAAPAHGCRGAEDEGLAAVCPIVRPTLEVASALAPSGPDGWTTLPAARGCRYLAGGFARDGIVALANCESDRRDAPSGRGVLVRFSAHDRVIRRIALAPGLQTGQLQ